MRENRVEREPCRNRAGWLLQETGFGAVGEQKGEVGVLRAQSIGGGALLSYNPNF